MPRSTPLPDWGGEDVYVIGGGPSLTTFDFARLHGLNTIGCNQAFLLGVDKINICIWGDLKFWYFYENGLAAFNGWVVTNYLLPDSPPWLKYYHREQDGLGKDFLGWNFNTGCSAVNLALILGSQRVFLLGFDMGRDGAKQHWHGKSLEQAGQDHYDRFQEGFAMVERCLPVVFPGRQVFNVTDGSSKLRAFPQCTFAEAGI